MGSSRPTDWTHVPCIGRRILIPWATREVLGLLLCWGICYLCSNTWVLWPHPTVPGSEHLCFAGSGSNSFSSQAAQVSLAIASARLDIRSGTLPSPPASMSCLLGICRTCLMQALRHGLEPGLFIHCPLCSSPHGWANSSPEHSSHWPKTTQLPRGKRDGFLSYLKWCLFLILVLAVLGLCCFAQDFSGCGVWGPLSSCVVRASHWGGFSCCGAQSLGSPASVAAAVDADPIAVVHELSCSVVCGILPDQGSNPSPLQWNADSYPLCLQGSPWRVSACYEFYFLNLNSTFFPPLPNGGSYSSVISPEEFQFCLESGF